MATATKKAVTEPTYEYTLTLSETEAQQLFMLIYAHVSVVVLDDNRGLRSVMQALNPHMRHNAPHLTNVDRYASLQPKDLDR